MLEHRSEVMEGLSAPVAIGWTTVPEPVLRIMLCSGLEPDCFVLLPYSQRYKTFRFLPRAPRRRYLLKAIITMISIIRIIIYCDWLWWGLLSVAVLVVAVVVL